MKKYLFLLSVLMVSISSFGQIGIGTTNPNSSAALDVTSVTKGFLPPRMTNQQKNAIANPAQGLMVYCTDCGANGQLNVFNGTAWSNAIGQVASSSVPNSPTNLVVTPGNQEVSVAFSNPVFDGGSPITGYTLTLAPGGATVSGTASPLSISGLNSGTTYTLSLVATNSVGNSPAASASAITFSVPDAPTNILATGGNSEATISFTAPTSNGGSAITGYTVVSTPGSFTATGSSSPLTVTGLSAGTSYSFAVYATNVIGNSPTATATASTFSVPDAPTNMVVTTTATSASITFTAPTSNGGSSITSYSVVSNPGGFSASGASSPLLVTGLSSGTSYSFDLTAINSIGSSAVASITASTSAQSVPGSPTNVLATVANAQSSVSFTAPTSDGGSSITGYTVTSSPGGFTASGTSSPIVVTGLTNGTAYTFTVVATNAIGNSTGASSASVTPELPITAAPTNLFALPGNNGVTFSYVAPSGTVSGYNIEYKAVSATVWTSLPVTTTSTVISGLTNNVAYEFKVGATNLTGAGPVSSSVMIEPVSQPVIFTENFNASTFDTTKWLEKETTTAQIGATVGDITLSNGQLSARSAQTGGSQWATRYLKTNSTFARANGDLVFQMDVTYTDCTSSNANSFFYWGPIQTTGGSLANGTSTSAATIINRLNSNGAFRMYTYGPIQGATTGQTFTNTTSACTNSITTHYKIVVKQAGGVDVYRNGESTPSLSHTATENFAARDNYPLSIMPAGDVDAMRVDNIVISQ